MCNCIDEINQAFINVGSNTELDIPFTIQWETGEAKVSDSVLIVTRKRNEKSRKKPSHVFASYCPFCGEKYSLQ